MMREVMLAILLSTLLGCGPEFQSGGEGGTAGTSGSGGIAGSSGSSSTAGMSAVGGSQGLAGSGGAPESEGCPLSPCGGEVVGTWQITSVCTDWLIDPATTGSCPSASSVNNVQKSGSYTYGADGAFSWDTITGGTTTVTLPAACLSGVTSCAALEAEFTPANGYESGSCSGKVSTSCTCTATLTDEPSEGSGTYELADRVLTAILGSDTSSSAYCVKGGKLTTQYTATNVVTTIVASKL
jgi:hypothetical protein